MTTPIETLHAALFIVVISVTALALVVDVDERAFESPVVPRRSLSPDIALRLTVAEPERASPARGGLQAHAIGGARQLRQGDGSGEREERQHDQQLQHGEACGRGITAPNRGTPLPNPPPPQVGPARLAHHVAQPGQARVALGGGSRPVAVRRRALTRQPLWSVRDDPTRGP